MAVNDVNQVQDPVPKIEPVPKTDQAPGIVGSAYKAPEVKPVVSDVDPESETVESRLNKLTAKGSKYTELAASDAQRRASGRGLINTAMAAGSGTEAGIRAALPIAQQDASTYSRARETNQAARNEFLRNRQSANLNMETAGFQSGLSREEDTLRNDLEMKRAAAGSVLTQAEQAQLNDLNMQRDTASSQLSREEEALLSDLNIKRDRVGSELSQEEQRQIADLEMKRDAARSGLSVDEMKAQSELNIERDKNSAALNDASTMLESNLRTLEEANSIELKKQAEIILNDAKFSDEVKLRYVTSINDIISNTNQDIIDIGLSDRTADQQTAAIQLAQDNRDAGIAVYQELLSGFNDWDWGTDFTPEQNIPASTATENQIQTDIRQAFGGVGELGSPQNLSDY